MVKNYKKIGYFYPIINFATLENKPTFAVGERDFEDIHEAVEMQAFLSEISRSIGNIVYVCSIENGNFFKNIHVMD